MFGLFQRGIGKEIEVRGVFQSGTVPDEPIPWQLSVSRDFCCVVYLSYFQSHKPLSRPSTP